MVALMLLPSSLIVAVMGMSAFLLLDSGVGSVLPVPCVPFSAGSMFARLLRRPASTALACGCVRRGLVACARLHSVVMLRCRLWPSAAALAMFASAIVALTLATGAIDVFMRCAHCSVPPSYPACDILLKHLIQGATLPTLRVTHCALAACSRPFR